MIELYYTYDKETLVVNQIGISSTRFSAIPEHPRDALLVKPLEEKDGFAVIVCNFENGRPTDTEYVEDHRGKTIYDISDCTVSKTVTKLGEIEVGFTLSKPSSQFDIWDNTNDNWQLDTQKKYEHDYQVVNNTRESLYVEMVDRLRNEARSIREIENDEEKALNYESQANAAYLKIREDNPWPAVPSA